MNIELGNTLSWAWPILLAGIAMPIISIINGLTGWSIQRKKATVVGVSVVLAVLYVIAAGLIVEIPQSWADIVTRVLVNAAIIVVVTQAVYNFFKPSLTKLENKVSGGDAINEQAAQEG